MQHDTVNKEFFVEAIIDGDCDSFIDAISGAIKRRREIKNETKILFISPGDTVRFNSQTRPQYLQGLLADVVKVNKKRVVVKVQEGGRAKARKFGYGEFTTPVSLVEKVEL
jgi:hypothetical protein